jgi:hypothetical protein
MWERLTPADLDHARNRLATSRAEMLRTHADEIRALDAQQDDIETLERLLASFAQKYLSSATVRSAITAASPLEQTNLDVATDADERPTNVVEQKRRIPVDLRVQQELSPNFGTPPRLRRLIGE